MELTHAERVRLQEEAFEKECRDNASHIKEAYTEGKQAGKVETVKRLLNANLTSDQVFELVDLPLAEIEKLTKDLQ
jgi:predicted transposase/invertase (TIGR01784 family)